MLRSPCLLFVSLTCGFALAMPSSAARAAESDSITRQVTFELSLANRDLVWLGDPASPTSMVYVKPGAKPIATDACVTTLSQTHSATSRRYMREARVVTDGKSKKVHAFTNVRELVIGTIDDAGHFQPNDVYRNSRKLLPSWPSDASVLAYDADQDALYYKVDTPGPVVTESLDFLPLQLLDAKGQALLGTYSIDYNAGSASVSLNVRLGSKTITLATATLPKHFRAADAKLGSFDNQAGTYLPEAAYRAGASAEQASAASVTFTIPGNFTGSLESSGAALVLRDATSVAPAPSAKDAPPAQIKIDGNFDDWRNVTGVDDPRGDLVPYLEYIADVDILEFKVSNDDQHIYFYARVAGQVGRTHTDGGRSYFYAYMDVDQNPGTGFLPTRDDDCYYGVTIGDDCEVQFEFVDNVFRKTFYGFCGLGGDENVLKRVVTLGKSQYGRLDEHGRERADYKAEYVYKGGVTEITEDLKLGTSDTITLAVSPDGSEVEVVSDLSGFLKDASGKPTVALEQTIDVAAGMESDSKAFIGKTRWAADSTLPIRNYKLRRSAVQK